MQPIFASDLWLLKCSKVQIYTSQHWDAKNGTLLIEIPIKPHAHALCLYSRTPITLVYVFFIHVVLQWCSLSYLSFFFEEFEGFIRSFLFKVVLWKVINKTCFLCRMRLPVLSQSFPKQAMLKLIFWWNLVTKSLLVTFFLRYARVSFPIYSHLHVCLCVMVFYYRGSRHCSGSDDYQFVLGMQRINDYKNISLAQCH